MSSIEMPVRVSVEVDGHSRVATIQPLDSYSFCRQHAADWRPLLRSEEKGDEDAEWDWAAILETDCKPETGHIRLGLFLGERCEGIIVIRLRESMRVSGLGLEGSYICYLAAAPWNRERVRNRAPMDKAKVQPVGKALFWRAIFTSVSLGLEGRVGLHSKLHAESRYRDMFPGIDDGLNDPAEEGLRWMELSALVARVFARGVTCDAEGVYHVPRDA